MGWQLSAYPLLGFGAASLSFLVAVGVLRSRDERGARSLATLLLALSAWSFVYAVQLGFTTAQEQLLWQRASLAIAGIVPVLWLVFALQYAGRTDRGPNDDPGEPEEVCVNCGANYYSRNAAERCCLRLDGGRARGAVVLATGPRQAAMVALADGPTTAAAAAADTAHAEGELAAALDTLADSGLATREGARWRLTDAGQAVLDRHGDAIARNLGREVRADGGYTYPDREARRADNRRVNRARDLAGAGCIQAALRQAGRLHNARRSEAVLRTLRERHDVATDGGQETCAFCDGVLTSERERGAGVCERCMGGGDR